MYTFLQDLYLPCVDLSSTTIKNIEKNDDLLTRSMGTVRKDDNEKNDDILTRSMDKDGNE